MAETGKSVNSTSAGPKNAIPMIESDRRLSENVAAFYYSFSGIPFKLIAYPFLCF